MQRFLPLLRQVLATHRAIARQVAGPPPRLTGTSPGGPRPLLFYSQVAWDTVWQRPQELALGLSRHRPVVFVSPLQPHEIARLGGRWKPVQHPAPGLTVLTPAILAGEYRSPTVRQVNRAILSRTFERVAGKLARPPLFLTNSPFAAWIPRVVPCAAVAYDIIDDFAAFDWAPPEGREQEDDLLAVADLVTAGTGFLRRRYRRFFPAIEFLPSGVDVARLTAAAPEPADLRALPHPRVLYVGTLNDRLDGALFAEAAAAVPSGSVAVVGPKHATFTAPALPGNVHFLGLKPHGELPGYYQHCDLGIMPFADNDAARAINPVKTLEYLACGLPVLSTPIPDVCEYYDGVVETARPGAWTAALRALLERDSPAHRDARREFAQGRSWARLVEAFEAKLAALEEATCTSSS